ncbi:uncharacterized protein LOC124294682 [Neodiprion lecontei]|uniref:Uncharacterized protein LOC124294682 n=1 Tax=Neodiprion lecontei TaxID=441921 RepID=A0ABM3G9Z0_NEOLC|nr:uncharacterized protein LOC124294682 [Neodiprion lecontei]
MHTVFYTGWELPSLCLKTSPNRIESAVIAHFFIILYYYTIILLHSLRLTKTRGALELNVEEKVEQPEVDAKDEEEIHHGERKNGTLLEGKTSIDGQGTHRTIYVNCSTAGVTCRTVMCDLNMSKTSGEVEISILDMIFDLQPLLTTNGYSFISFSTDARALILEPILLDTMNGSRFVEAKASTVPNRQFAGDSDIGGFGLTSFVMRWPSISRP